MGEAPLIRMSYAEYLEAEARSEEKHEYLRGEVWAMAGGTPEHGLIAMNVASVIRNAISAQKRPCSVFSSDVRVRISETDRTTYPDISVVCGKRQHSAEDPHALTNPLLIVEVLSEGTEASDRGEKFAHYGYLESLQEYVLVNQRTRRVEVFRRQGKQWLLTVATAGESIRLESVGADLQVDEIYHDPTAP